MWVNHSFYQNLLSILSRCYSFSKSMKLLIFIWVFMETLNTSIYGTKACISDGQMYPIDVFIILILLLRLCVYWKPYIRPYKTIKKYWRDWGGGWGGGGVVGWIFFIVAVLLDPGIMYKLFNDPIRIIDLKIKLRNVLYEIDEIYDN